MTEEIKKDQGHNPGQSGQQPGQSQQKHDDGSKKNPAQNPNRDSAKIRTKTDIGGF
jgi:hypothetical protein